MIKVDTIGRIASGDDQGKFVKVESIPGEITSYLVLTAGDHDFTVDGGDEWVENFSSLEEFFEEARWVVGWEEDLPRDG